jgi:hypothetical protein
MKLGQLLVSLGFQRAGYYLAFVRCDSGEKHFIFLCVDDLIIIAKHEVADKFAEHILESYKGVFRGEPSDR